MDLKEWAKFQESLLRSQLKVIREFLKDNAEPEPPPQMKRRSQIGIVYDVLTKAKEPLHLTEIIRRAKIKTSWLITLNQKFVLIGPPRSFPPA